MITGSVNGQFEIIVPLPFEDSAGQEHLIDTVLDSGFTGSVSLPNAIVNKLRLPFHSKGSAVLANGTIETFDIHAGTIVWDGATRSVLIPCIETKPLLGTALLPGFDLRARFVSGGVVEIERVP